VARRASRAGSATDADVAAFAASLENALSAAYAEVSRRVSDPALANLVSTFRLHHQQHARTFNTLAGAKGVGSTPNAKWADALLGPLRLAKDQTAVLAVVATAEDRLAATYQFALENLETASAARLTASVLPVEAQHAVVWEMVLGRPARSVIPASFQGKDGFVDPTQFPVSG
jgi:hypothetical protein